MVSAFRIRVEILPDYLYQAIYKDEFLCYYMPTLALIIVSEFLFLNKSELFLFINKSSNFLTAFRLKHLISLLLIPRLWFGDQSLVLKSRVYSFYCYIFSLSSIAFGIAILSEGIYKMVNGKYLFIIDNDEVGTKGNSKDLKYNQFFRLK